MTATCTQPLLLRKSGPAAWKQRENVALGLVGITFLFLLVPAVLEARTTARDEGRINDLAQIKRHLEQYFNAHESFPRTGEAHPLPCVFSDSTHTALWESTEPAFAALPLPRERRQGWPAYAYCPTPPADADSHARVAGFFLEASLERPAPETNGFDNEPGRNYRFRVRRDGAYTVYRICGGEDRSCDRGTTG